MDKVGKEDGSIDGADGTAASDKPSFPPDGGGGGQSKSAHGTEISFYQRLRCKRDLDLKAYYVLFYFIYI